MPPTGEQAEGRDGRPNRYEQLFAHGASSLESDSETDKDGSCHRGLSADAHADAHNDAHRDAQARSICRSTSDPDLQRFLCFIHSHTRPVDRWHPTTAPSTAPNKECPICQEEEAKHECVQIKYMAGCAHMIGKACLLTMLAGRPKGEKKCPFCRTLWLQQEECIKPGDGGYVLHDGQRVDESLYFRFMALLAEAQTQAQEQAPWVSRRVDENTHEVRVEILDEERMLSARGIPSSGPGRLEAMIQRNRMNRQEPDLNADSVGGGTGSDAAENRPFYSSQVPDERRRRENNMDDPYLMLLDIARDARRRR